jgi:mannose-6-phosphate isomerase-like protein (cupin superfamily)
MNVIREQDKPTASWRPGKFGRLHAAASVGNTVALCVNESWNEPGIGAPTHHHPDGCEEIIMVLEGTAEFWVDGVHDTLGAGDLVILPPYSKHGFTNVGEDKLHVLAVFSTPAPETLYDEDPDTVVEIGGTSGDAVDATRTARAKA